LEQCNSKATLATGSWKNCKGRVGLSFHWDAFGIEGIDEEKMVSFDFGGAWWSCRHLVLGLPCSGR